MSRFTKLITVEPVLFLFMMGMFIQLPTSQMLILRKVCYAMYNDSICTNLDEKKYEEHENIVQTKTSHWILFLQLFGAIPGAVMSLIFGSCSDKLGRRIIMVIPVMGNIISGLVLLLSAYYIELDLNYLIIGALAVGFTGNFGTFYIALISYIADITTEDTRTKRLGILESMVFIGGTLGLLFAGVIIQKFGLAAVYICVVTLYIIITIYVAFWLEESLPSAKRQYEKDEKDKDIRCLSSLWDSIWRALRVFFKKRKGDKRKYLLLLQCMTILGVLVMSGEMDLTVLYTKHQPLSWSAALVGVYLALKNTCKGVALIAGLPLYYYIRGKKEPHRDIILGQVGLLSNIASLILISLAETTVAMMCMPFVGSLAGLTGAVMGAMKTQLVQPTEFGAMFACSSFLDTMCSLLGSVLFNSLYPATLEYWPGLSFMVMAVLASCSLCMLTYIQCSMKNQPTEAPLGDADQVANLLTDESDEEEIDASTKMEPMYDWGRDQDKS